MPLFRLILSIEETFMSLCFLIYLDLSLEMNIKPACAASKEAPTRLTESRTDTGNVHWRRPGLIFTNISRNSGNMGNDN